MHATCPLALAASIPDAALRRRGARSTTGGAVG